MLFYVEMGVRYTNQYGDINESFYTSMESMYENATKHISYHFSFVSEHQRGPDAQS
jgi:hypothetical protein